MNKKKLSEMTVQEIEELQYNNAERFINFHIAARIVVGIMVVLGLLSILLF